MLVPEFESIPAYEAVKIDVVMQLQNMRKAYSEIMQYMNMNKYPRSIVAFFKSEVLAFYMGIRPKILDITTRDKEYLNLIHFGDKFVPHPNRFTLGSAVKLFLGLNQFCEDYRLTSTTYFMGGSRETEGDTY